MAFIEFFGSRKLRIFGMGKYIESESRMNRREAELYCIAHGLRFDGFCWDWQRYVATKVLADGGKDDDVD